MGSRGPAPREKAAPEAAMGVGGQLLPILLLAGWARGEGEHKLTHEQSLVAPAAPRTAGYPEEPYYDYATYPDASYQNQASTGPLYSNATAHNTRTRLEGKSCLVT